MRDDTITHQKSNDKIGEKIMCPVRACLELINKIRTTNIPENKIPDLKINTVVQNGKISTIPASSILNKI